MFIIMVCKEIESYTFFNIANIINRPLAGADPGGGVEGVATPCFVGHGRQDNLASQTLPAREGLACETAPRSGPLALTCKSRCHPR